MKGILTILGLVLSIGFSFGQCDSLHLIIEERTETYFKKGSYQDRIIFLSESVDNFINCSYYEEAMSWQYSKILEAHSELRFSEQITFMKEADSLFKRYQDEFPEQKLIEHKSKNMQFWFDIYSKTGNHTKALINLTAVEEILDIRIENLSEESKKTIQNSLIKLGSEYHRKKEYHIAIKFYEESLKYIQSRENILAKLSNESLVLGYLAQIYLEIGEQIISKSYTFTRLEKSEQLLDLNIEFKGHYISALRVMSDWYMANNNLDSSAFYLDQAFRYEKQLEYPSYGSRLLKVKLLIAQNRMNEAIDHLKKLLYDYGGITNFEKNRKISRSLEIAALLIKVEELDSSRALIKTIDSALKKKIDVKQNLSTKVFHLDEGLLLELYTLQISLSNNNVDSLVKLFDKASEIIISASHGISTKYDKFFFAKQSLAISEKFLKHLPIPNQDYHKNAFSAIESSKAATLFNEWKQKQYYALNNNQNIFTQEQIIEEQIGAKSKQFLLSNDSTKSVVLKKEIDHLGIRLDSIKNQLKNAHLSYYKMKYDWQNPSIHEVQSQLTDDEVYIDYFEGETTLFAMLISNESSIMKRIPDLEEIKNLINQYSKLIFTIYDDGAQRKINLLSYDLYQHLIKPFEDQLKENIIISPSGILNQLPFSTFRKDEKLDSDGLLIMDHSISYTPSASMFFQGRSTPNKSIVTNGLFVAPKFKKHTTNQELIAMRSSLGELRYNIEEVESISSAMNSQLLLNEQASKSAFLSNISEADLLHFASHAKSNEDAPDRSFIAFYSSSAEEIDTNLLYLDELSKLHIPAKMIVLSACETGLGKIYKGEGAMSLANACFYAGSESVVATLWSVQDKTTSVIMESFYKHLAEGQNKDKAMQLAQIDFIKNNAEEFQHPYFWAGFSVFGNTSELKFKKDNSLRNSLLVLTAILLLSAAVFYLRRRPLSS